MFKKRLIETLKILVIIPLIFITWTGICYLIINYTPFSQVFDWAQLHREKVIATFLIIALLIPVLMFINWLFVEPYKAYKKSKNVSQNK